MENIKVIPGQLGTDLTALNSLQAVGTRAGYPSAPTQVTASVPIAILGELRIADQLLQARDRGVHRDGELAMTQQQIAYSYSGMYQKNISTIKLLEKVSATDFLEYSRDRDFFFKEALSRLINAFNSSAMMESN